MTELYLLRHAPTAWNLERRIQGHTDIPLHPDSDRKLRMQTLHPDLKLCQTLCSPLQRARQTAEALGIEDPIVVEELIEMHWGSMEGKPLKVIEEEISTGNIHPATGLDFCPPGGESPRQVSRRIADWIRLLGSGPYLAVTHKGVMRAALSLASGWDMEAPYTDQIDWQLALHMGISAEGNLNLKAINHPVFAPAEKACN